MGHNVGKAAAQAVERSNKTKTTDRTPEQILNDIRRNLDAHLAVTPSDQRFLLAKYDDVHALLALAFANDGLKNEEITTLRAQVQQLTEKNEEFRRVYEEENQTTKVRVDNLLPSTEEIAIPDATGEPYEPQQ